MTWVVGRYTTFRPSSICARLFCRHGLQPAHNAMMIANPASIATVPSEYVMCSGFRFVQCSRCLNVDKIFSTLTTRFSSLSKWLKIWLISWFPMICSVSLMSNVFSTSTADLNIPRFPMEMNLNPPALQTHPSGTVTKYIPITRLFNCCSC